MFLVLMSMLLMMTVRFAPSTFSRDENVRVCEPHWLLLCNLTLQRATWLVPISPSLTWHLVRFCWPWNALAPSCQLNQVMLNGTVTIDLHMHS